VISLSNEEGKLIEAFNEKVELIEELKNEVMELQERLIECQYQNFLLERKLKQEGK